MQLMNSYPGFKLAHRFFSGTGHSYDHIVHLCTIGFDIWWKKKIMAKIPARPLKIIDQACGTGILTFKIAEKFPHCRVIGIELRDEYLRFAQQKAKALKSSTVAFILGRAEDIVLESAFDCITSSYLAKYADLATLVQNAKKMLKPEGVLIMHDFTYPSGRIFSWIWERYFRILQTVGAFRYPEWRTAFNELPTLLHETEWVNDLLRILPENGFFDVTIENLTFGTSAIVSATRA